MAVIDDDESVRKALTRMLRTAGLEILTFSSAQDFFAAEEKEQISCVIADLRMPGIDGLQLQNALKERMPRVSIVFLTGHADVSSSVRAMKSGAIDFLEKPVKRAELLEAIERAVRQSTIATRQTLQLGELKRRYERLTRREREVFALVTVGRLNKQVAAELSISEKTVKQHRRMVVDKMRADSLADLVLMADRLGIITPQNDFSNPQRH